MPVPAYRIEMTSPAKFMKNVRVSLVVWETLNLLPGIFTTRVIDRSLPI